MTNKNDKILAPIKQRIIEVIENQTDKKKDIFDNLNVASSNFRGSALFSEVSADVVAKILTMFPNTNPDWLILGKGCKVRSDNPALENVNWISPNVKKRHVSEQFDENALLRVGLRIYEVCKHFNITMQELGDLVDDENISDYVSGNIPVPEKVLDKIIKHFDISEKWLYTSYGELAPDDSSKKLKQFLYDTQKRLVEYQEIEIHNLKKEIEELKKRQSESYVQRVAEDSAKLTDKKR